MSKESRPVPRRESPWGITGDNHPEPKAHRCNDRVEDVIQVLNKGGELCRLALRETHSRLFRDLSSSSGSACVQNLGQNYHLPCNYIYSLLLR
ncbi:hypothetical protein VIGAN_07085100 [Vigna angularis var. angularis]|uniref:Uncharacterized protein n=1 Tax=Vigna angularis var. angularis TaxID=157739 RepID=A0A0S3SH93_PHAAN|nr:hypothetical protein VIGAN_07085100 [Vigna angularis var. angularis]